MHTTPGTPIGTGLILPYDLEIDVANKFVC